MTATTTAATNAPAIDERVARLNAISAKRLVDPETTAADANLRDPRPVKDQVLPDELLSLAALPEVLERLTPEQRARLSREEIASIATAGVRFEAVLTAGFATEIATSHAIGDPRVTYLFHEIGEESRHSRLFIKLVDVLAPESHNPLDKPLLRRLMRLGVRHIVSRPALLYTLVLAGEEIPDLFQKLASEHPDTDEVVRSINRYHRQEEARHLSFARAVLPEIWERASWHDRFAVRYVAPVAIRGMFETMVHPGVYGAVGLPTWPTWKAVNRAPTRIALRHEATRSVVKALVEAGVFPSESRVPKGWRRLAGLDAAAADTGSRDAAATA